VVDTNVKYAQDTLRKAGYARVDVTPRASTRPEGTVLGQSRAGSFPTDTAISLIVSAGQNVPR
jgi:beta-lactam-binding protein with PASTA domain